jgi:hypothetical protein
MGHPGPEEEQALKIEGDRPSADGVSRREEVFWNRYRRTVLAAGISAGVADWYRRHVEQFIRHLQPQRLREASPGDVTAFLVRTAW